jgi:hypothetical protein
LNVVETDKLVRVELFVDDLKPKVAKRLLQALGCEKPEDGNYDVFPLYTIEVEKPKPREDGELAEAIGDDGDLEHFTM